MNRRQLLSLGMAAALLLLAAVNAEAWVRYRYSYGGYRGGYYHYNRYSGGYYHGGAAGYNRYTGRYGASRSYYNPYTGRYGSVQGAYNPYTNRYAYHYRYY
jgi:hypothetical protein